MPINYEPAAPIAAFGNIYEQAAAIEARNRNAQMAAAASRGGGGGSEIPYDTGIQQAIFARDQMRSSNYNQQADRETASNMQNDKFALESQLSSMQLTQQENMRLQRMKNAIGDVQNDPTLSAEEKSDMTMQLKTGISPLAQRATQAKMAADQQLKEQQAEQHQWLAAAQKSKVDALGKSPEERTGFTPDAAEISKIAEDIGNNADLPPMLPQERDAAIAKMAKQEAIRQGLGTTSIMHPDGTETIIRGPGSKEHEAIMKGEASGAGGKGEWTEEKFVKMREYAEKLFDKRAEVMKDDPNLQGAKVLAHPELQDLKVRAQAVKDHLKEIGAPTTLEEMNASKREKPKGYGYDSTAAAWNKGKEVAAAATPATNTASKPFDFNDEKTQTPEQKSDVANLQSLGDKLKASPAPPEVRQAAIVAHQEARTLLANAGSYAAMKPEDKKKYVKALEEMAAAVKYEPPPPVAAAATPQQPQNPTAQPTLRSDTGQPQVTPAQAVGNAWRYATGQLGNLPSAIQGANPFLRKRAGSR